MAEAVERALRGLGVKEYVTVGSVVVSIVAWLIGIQYGIADHVKLDHHKGVLPMVERRIDEKTAIHKAIVESSVVKVLLEIDHLKREISEMRSEFRLLRDRIDAHRRLRRR